jgi:hypothetical protein
MTIATIGVIKCTAIAIIDLNPSMTLFRINRRFTSAYTSQRRLLPHTHLDHPWTDERKLYDSHHTYSTVRIVTKRQSLQTVNFIWEAPNILYRAEGIVAVSPSAWLNTQWNFKSWPKIMMVVWFMMIMIWWMIWNNDDHDDDGDMT